MIITLHSSVHGPGFPTSHRCNGCPPTAVRLYSPNDQMEDGRSIVLYYVIQLCVIKYQSGNDIHCHQLYEQSVLNMKCTNADKPLEIITLQRTEW